MCWEQSLEGRREERFLLAASCLQFLCLAVLSGKVLLKPGPPWRPLGEDAEGAVQKGGTKTPQGERGPMCDDRRDGHTVAGPCGLAAKPGGVWPGRPGKGQKLHASHPMSALPIVFSRAWILRTTSSSQLLGPEPPSQLCRSSLTHPGQASHSAARGVPALPCSHPNLPHPSSAARRTFQKSSCHSSAPNPPRPSGHKRWVLKQSPCWGREDFVPSDLPLTPDPPSAPALGFLPVPGASQAAPTLGPCLPPPEQNLDERRQLSGAARAGPVCHHKSQHKTHQSQALSHFSTILFWSRALRTVAPRSLLTGLVQVYVLDRKQAAVPVGPPGKPPCLCSLCRH